TGRDDFSPETIRTLAQRAGNRCSNPNCLQQTIGPQPSNSVGVINIGVAAHITAASPGGKRYDPSLSIDQRRSISNGIWLCQSCAKLIDSDEKTFSIPLLRGWKEEAERRAFEAIARPSETGIAILERRLA